MKLSAQKNNKIFIIKPDFKGSGFYLFVYDENDKEIADYVLDTEKMAKKFANEEFGVPLDSWNIGDMNRGEEYDQIEFTDYIISNILESFPFLKQNCKQDENGFATINYSSKKGNLIFWITTQYREITIGFDTNKECSWHIHMSSFGDTPKKELTLAKEYIENILDDKELISYNPDEGYFISDSPNEEEKSFYWSEL